MERLPPGADTTVLPARGGSFLTESRAPHEIFTPEDFSDEQRLIAATASDFVGNEVLPRLPAILALDYAAIRGLMRRAGDLGLLGIEIPQAYGGLGLGKVTGCLACEQLAHDASFFLTFLAHTGMGTLPIADFGTEEQRSRYLPRLASGEWIGSYSLSEASSASDALAARTRATLSSDNTHWVLDGEKMWLSNAGIADLYITFARVDGERLSAFIVERDTRGVSLGREERKVGLKGASTRPLVLSGAAVARGNLLGEMGRGHLVAFSTLDVGRLKLGAGNTAAAKNALTDAVRYARTRTAFGRPIAEFGLIQKKIAEMAIRAYAAESMVYRTAAMIDRSLADRANEARPGPGLIGEYDVECAIVKVWCSEALASTVDEYVQILGGAGYVEDHPAERYWRDARGSRILEGTSEVNRLLIAGRLVRSAFLVESPRLGTNTDTAGRDCLEAEERILTAGKEVVRCGLRASIQTFRETLRERQEVLGFVADMAMEVFALESALLRARKRLIAKGEGGAGLQVAAVRCLAEEALDRIATSARRLVGCLASGDVQQDLRATTRHLLDRDPIDIVTARRLIAEAAVETQSYPLS
jgi:alkylation response protein AidB-like acyl-CoA dehydrogenase